MRPDNSNRPTSLSAEILKNFATEEQQRAVAGNHQGALRKADDRALAQAILASLAEIKDGALIDTSSLPLTSAKTSSPAVKETPGQKKIRSASTDHVLDARAASRKINSQLTDWLNNHGFEVIHNTGRNENCLLISMTQHKTENYNSEHVATVNDLREKVKNYTKTHYPNKPSMNDFSLHCDDDVTLELMKEINKGITDVKEKLSFWFVTADSDGKPSWRRVGDGHKVAIIFDKGGHYEAVVPRSA